MVHEAHAAPASAEDCSALLHASVADTTITSAGILPSGTTLHDPDGRPVPVTTTVCRVVASVSTRPSEKIGIEVWMPIKGWNGKFLGLGSGGFGGAPFYTSLVPAAQRGFAAANTDTGHTGQSKGAIGKRLEWANNPVQLQDWGRTSIHLMTLASKQIVAQYYGKAANRAYYSGCSTGGAEAMAEAEFYPKDYDGIHAGSPGMQYSHLMESFFWGAKLPAQQPEATLTPTALSLLNRAVLQACGGDTAVKDGFLDNPLACHFSPETLLCKPGVASENCLSAAQVHEADRLYSPVTDSRSGKVLYPGMARGSEAQWKWMQGALVPAYAQPLVANAVYHNPDWDWTTFDFGADADRIDATLAPVTDAMDTNLSAFRAHGGKLLMTQGWSDPLNAQTLPISYFEQTAKRYGGLAETQRFFRLAMVPGLGHCGFGPGANTIGGYLPAREMTPQRDVISALEAWVEKDKAPTQFIATKYHDENPKAGVQFERTVCVYPNVPRYRGEGDRNDATSYRCVPAARMHVSMMQ